MSLVKVNCTQCGQAVARRKHKLRKSGVVLCSTGCSSRYFQEKYSDEFTMFRHMFMKHRGYAKRRFLVFTITIEDVKALWEKQRGICALSGIELVFGENSYAKRHGGSTASLDRIDSRYGYTPDNIQIIHKGLQDIKKHYPQSYIVNWACLIADCKRGRDNRWEKPPEFDSSAQPCYTSANEDPTPF